MKNNYVLSTFLWSFTYLAFCALVAYTSLCYVNDLRTFHPDLIDNIHLEKSFIEYGQTAILSTTLLLFIAITRVYKNFAPLSITLATMISCALIREQDYFLETMIIDNGWQIAVFSLLAVYFMYLRNHFQQFKELLTPFVKSSTFGLFLGGFMFIFVFSRIIGSKYYWQAVMDELYFKLVKSMVEENMELAGYTILLIATIEFWRYVRRA